MKMRCGQCVRSAYLDDPETEGKDSQPGHLQMLDRKRQADDGDGKKCREQQVHQRQLQAGKKDPDDVHDDGDGAAWRFGFTDFLAERREPQDRQLEALDTERNTDNGDTQDHAAKYIGERDEETT